MIDVLIRNAAPVDKGSGELVNIAIVDDKIVAIGQRPNLRSQTTIEANGKTVSPGFIDTHTHDDLVILECPQHQPKLLQGVTSIVIGNCGHGCAPTGAHVSQLREYSEPVLGEFPGHLSWSTFSEYLQVLKNSRVAVNVAGLLPHGALRASILGFEPRRATEAEIDRMVGSVREAMQGGAVGLSLGLMYAPGCFAERQELVAIAREVGRYGGILTCHMRNEGARLLQSIAETVSIGQEAETPIHISHLKSIGTPNHGQMGRAVEELNTLRERGVDVTCDVYPYSAGSTTVTSLMPLWALEGGTGRLLGRIRNPSERDKIKESLSVPWGEMENHLLGTGYERAFICGLRHPRNQKYEGKNLSEIAQQENLDADECLLRIIDEEEGRATILMFQMADADVEEAIKWPWSMIGSDGLPLRSGNLHPRHFGTFPRVLSTYVREKRTLSLQEALRKMTDLPAERFGLRDRGRIEEGAIADLILFAPGTVKDLATYEQPRTYPEGIELVMVAGKIVAQSGAATGELPGSVLNPM